MTNSRTIDELAARWHVRATIGRLSPEDEQRLDAWLAEDLRHRLAYAEAAAARYASEQIAPSAAVPARIARRWPAWTAAAFAPLLLLVAIFWTPHAWQDWRSDTHTAAGELHVEHLADGSTLQLDTDSAVALPFAPDHRDVQLLRGALAVEVAKDAAHPFRVHCAGVEARAVGTRFVVARHLDSVEVGVTEGIVAVRTDEHSEPVLIEAGQRLYVDARSGAIRRDVLSATSYGWTRGVFTFDHAPLQQVVADIARYLPEHIVFRAPAHAANPITATFPIDRPDAALLALATTNGLTVRRVPNLLYVIQD